MCNRAYIIIKAHRWHHKASLTFCPALGIHVSGSIYDENWNSYRELPYNKNYNTLVQYYAVLYCTFRYVIAEVWRPNGWSGRTRHNCTRKRKGDVGDTCWWRRQKDYVPYRDVSLPVLVGPQYRIVGTCTIRKLKKALRLVQLFPRIAWNLTKNLYTFHRRLDQVDLAYKGL